MELILLWPLLALAVGIWASNKGRSGFGWFLLAILISPLLAAIFLAVSADLSRQAEARPTKATHVKCPDCAELILKEAKVCKHCGCRLAPQYSDPEPGTLKTIIGDIPDTGASKVIYWVCVALVLAVVTWISKR